MDEEGFKICQNGFRHAKVGGGESMEKRELVVKGVWVTKRKDTKEIMGNIFELR